MCVSISTPKTPIVPEPAPTQPALQSPVESPTTATFEAVADDEKKRRAAAFGHSKTILTGSEGDLSSYKTDKKSLLGL